MDSSFVPVMDGRTTQLGDFKFPSEMEMVSGLRCFSNGTS